MMIQSFMILLFSLSLSGTILFAFWKILQLSLNKRLTRRFYYYLLLIVLLRFIIPISPSQSIVGGVFSLFESSSFYRLVTETPTVSSSQSSLLTEGAFLAEKTVSMLTTFFFFSWLLVAFFFIVQKITKYQSFVKYVKADWKPVDNPEILDILSTVCEEKKIKAVIDIYTTPLVSSPLLLGIKKSYIVLPYEEIAPEQLYCILNHELTHYKNKDLHYKWLMQIVSSLHWFNPVVYYIQKIMNQECEYACDESAIQAMDKDKRYEYGLTLIEMTKHPGKYKERVASVTLYENANEIKERLEAILNFSKMKKLGKPVMYAITFSLATFAFITGAYYAQPISQEPPAKNDTGITTTSESYPETTVESTEEPNIEMEPETEPSSSKPLGRHFS